MSKIEVLLAVLPACSAGRVRPDCSAFVFTPKVAGPTHTGDVYFAKPYHSWERGLNENTNGLLRQYFPKGMNFSKITAYQLKKVESELNDRPRKTLGYRTPREVMRE